MKKLTILTLFVAFLASCSPTLTVTNLQTNQTRKIKVKKINAIILNDGQVFTDDIGISNGNLTSEYLPIGWKTISTLEVRTTTFRDVIAFPLEITGLVAAGGGALVMGSALSDEEDMGSNLIVGGILIGAGAGLNRLGHAMRPTDKQSIKSLHAAEYNFGLNP